MENLTFWKKKVCFWFAMWVGFSCQLALGSGSVDVRDYSNCSLSGTDPLIFTFNCIDGRPGDTVCMPVTVQDFTDIVIFQFEIIWNSDVLDFIKVQNPGSPSINVNSDFNLSGPNTLKVIPLGFPIDGETLPDGTVLFEICFRIIGVPGSTSSLGISPYFDFEAVDPVSTIPVDSVSCNMTVQNAIELVGFVSSCGPLIPGGNGEIDVTVYGGTAPYNITWMESMGASGGPIAIPAEGGSMVLNVPTGDYDVTITDALGNIVTYNIVVDPLALGIITHLKHPTCYEFENGTMWIKPTGGTSPYSYIWESLTDPSFAGSGFIRNTGDSSLVTSLPDGTYHILVKDENGCEAEVTVVLNDNPFVFTVDNIQAATCNGSEDGVIMLTVTGATPDANGDYLIRIKDNPVFEVTTNNVSIGLLNPGEHCITVSDEVSQCDTVYCFTIGSSTEVTGNVIASDPSCFGGTNGSVTINGLTNGVPGPAYTYTIFNNLDVIEAVGNNVNGPFTYTGLAPGDFSVIVSEGPCVSDSIYFTITEALQMSVSLVGTSIDDCLDFPMFATGDAWFQITNGTAPYVLNAGMGTQDGDTIQNLNNGSYVVTVTDDNGCTATTTFTIFKGDDNEEADITFQIDGIPCEGGTITLLYQGGGLPPGASVSWNNMMYSGQTITIPASGILNADLAIPSIHCLLNDTAQVICTEKLLLDITVIQPTCNDEALGGPYTGTVIVDTMNAVPPVTWIWSFPDTTTTNIYSGLSPGIYYVTVTDAMDSIAIDTFEIIAPDAIHLSFFNADSTSCAGVCDGAVRVSPGDGDPAMDYFLYWTSTVPSADTGVIFQVDGLCEGINVFNVTQDALCFYEDEIEIIAPAPIDINSVAVIDATCHGYNDGSLEVIASGGTPGYSYAWTGGPSSPVNTGLSAGEYVVTAMDSKNCVGTDSFLVSEPDTLIAQIDLSGTLNLSCGASSDGIIIVDVSGGNNGGYSFEWNPDVSSIYQAVNLAAGNYLITVTDPMGCSDTTSYLLTSPPPIIVEWPPITPPACFGDETILQINSVSGGNGNYTFNINSGPSFDIGDPVMITSGIYIVSVFDDRGCSEDTTYTVIEPNPILVSIGPDDPIIDLGDSLFIIGQVDQSDNPIAMTAWSASVPVSCDTCAGTWVFNVLPTEYTWTVTDMNGCQGSSSITVGVDFDRDVFIPTVFTPNNDGRNDDFRIYTGPGVVSVNYIYIYDRWGNLVHSETSPLFDPAGTGNWDGTMDGEPLNPGVYVYVAEIQFIDNNTKLHYRGDVTLLK